MADPCLEHALRLFPTVVHLFQLPDHEALNATLERRIRKIRRRTPLWKGRASPWQCAPNLHQDPSFSPLVSAIHAAGRQVLDDLHYDVERLEITGMWANLLSRGEFHRPHAHANNFLSGVYFVKGGVNAPLHVLSPNLAAQVFRPDCSTLTPENSAEWRVDASDGRMILFPAWLRHFVPAVQADERLSIAFNIMCRGTMADPDSLQAGRF